MKKLVISVLLVLLTVTNLLASSNNEATQSKTQSVLRIIMSSGDAGPGNIKKALDKAAEKMDIKLEYDVIPDDQMLNVVNTRLITNNAADLIIHNFGLTDVSAEHLAALDGPWVSKITNTTKPLTMDSNGITRKAPLGGESNMGLLYNKKVLESAGVELPLKNFSEFSAALEKIKATGVTPLYISNKEVWTAQILLLTSMTSIFANDSDLVNKIVTNQIMPSDVPSLVKLFENAESLQKNGYINEDYMSASNDMGLEAIANEECAFYAMLDSSYGTIKEFYPDKVENIGMTFTPIWDNEKDGYVLFGTATNYISAVANSKNVELAKQFIDTMITEEPLKAYYSLVPGAVPYSNLGYDLPMSPLNAEMKMYAEDLNMASYSTFNNNNYNGATPLEPFYGKFNEQIQALYAGYGVKETLDKWYEAYAADAKARKVNGFN